MTFDPEDISIQAKSASVTLEVKTDPSTAMFLLAKLIRLAIPTIVGATSLTVMQFIDGWLVSLLDRRGIDGGVNLAASFNGGLTAFVPLALCFGVAGLVNTFMAQSVGKRQVEVGVQYTWQAIWLSIISIPVFALLAFYIGDIFQLFGHTGELLRLETLFSRYMLATAPINFAGLAIGSFFLGLHRPGIQVIAGITGNVVNLVLDYTLIFGNFGCPALHLLGGSHSDACRIGGVLIHTHGIFLPMAAADGFSYKRGKPGSTASFIEITAGWCTCWGAIIR